MLLSAEGRSQLRLTIADASRLNRSFHESIPLADRVAGRCSHRLAQTQPDQASWSVYAKLADENQQFVWGILEEASDPSRARNASEQKIGDYFEACIGEPAIDKLGVAPMQDDLHAIAALNSKQELGKFLGGEHLPVRGGMLFGFGSYEFPVGLRIRPPRSGSGNGGISFLRSGRHTS